MSIPVEKYALHSTFCDVRHVHTHCWRHSRMKIFRANTEAEQTNFIWKENTGADFDYYQHLERNRGGRHGNGRQNRPPVTAEGGGNRRQNRP